MAEPSKRYVLSTAAGLSDDLIEIGGREFHAWPLKLGEADKFKTGITYEQQLEALVGPMQARAVGDERVTAEFLLDNIDKPFLMKLMKLLVNGSLEDNPKV